MSALVLAVSILAGLASAQDYRDYLCKEIGRPFFRSSDGLVRLARRHAHPIAFARHKPSKTKRILVVGESVAAKLWSAERDALTEAAANAWPGWRIEVLNAGMTAYNSRRIAAVLEEGLAFELDAAIVLSGNNEHDALELCPSLWEGLERKFLRSAIYHRAMRAVERSAEDKIRAVSLARHEFHLRRMVRAARAKGVPIVLATLPANERDLPPAGEAPFSEADFAGAAAALEHGRAAEAARVFERRAAHRPEDAMTLWYLGRAQQAAGAGAAALGSYQEAVHHDPKGDRTSTVRNDLIRRVAKDEGAAVADLERAFREAAGGGPIGGDFLADGVHWYARLNPFVAARLLAALGAPVASPAPAPAASAVRREELLQTLLYGIRNVSYWAGTDQKGALTEVSLALLDRVDREAADWLLELSRSKAKLRPRLASNYWVQDLAADIDQWWPVYLAHVGEMHRRKGKTGLALEFFDHALAASPGRWRTRLWRAISLKALGRGKEAGDELKALEDRRDPVVAAVAAAY
ncbi:MAG: hypothetical protein HY553_08275 [Elusimicrobia bacterium]|nr:hypothetical protein [Elusimicrobiota bacterium]